jgi:ferrochelatase
VILPLFPQYSMTTTGAGFGFLRKIVDRNPALSKMDIRWVRSWHDHPGYIDAFADAAAAELAKFPEPDRAHILFSAHSIPESFIRRGDTYLDETRGSVEAIVKRLGRGNTWQLSFQSKIGPVKWLEPSTGDVIAELGRKQVRDVLIVPISFVSEHIETLYELDILYKETAEKAGVSNLRRVPALNSNPAFIKALADIARSAL